MFPRSQTTRCVSPRRLSSPPQPSSARVVNQSCSTTRSLVQVVSPLPSSNQAVNLLRLCPSHLRRAQSSCSALSWSCSQLHSVVGEVAVFS
ncbi:hypothetical protein DY000_02024493 [Brassica cretica]|uniref:Uncharacterized protein n=1 Tax=Brassica cretica TaxID=69181 RepID=A0ABQ7DZE5_BRACR|nr:hypothetical protein DY000_02024493 [Brassica cretica]